MNCYNPFPGSVGFHVVSVPIGWRFEPHARYGVVLCDMFGNWLTPQETALLAYTNGRGFRLVESVRLPAPVNSYRDVPPRALAKNIPDDAQGERS